MASFTLDIFPTFTAQVVLNLSKLYPKDMDVPSGGFDDMTNLPYLHEPGVLQNLATRYELNEIYVRLCSSSVSNQVISNLARKNDYCSYECSVIIFYIMTDLYWECFYCHQSIPKTAPFV